MKRVCIINTGGTLGMDRGARGYLAVPGFLATQLDKIGELFRPDMPQFDLMEYDPVIDSSNMSPENWLQIAEDICTHYQKYDGFVVIHGTDTMAHTTSALPFMLNGLNKSVIFTGSQIPLIEVRNDARENLITAILLAANYRIPEVCLYFGNRLLRGCRATKISATGFEAFDSPNYPPLGTAGTEIQLFSDRLRQGSQDAAVAVTPIRAQAIATFRLFPGVSHAVLRNVVRQPLVALVLETYGVGNGPSNNRPLLDVLEEANQQGTVIVNCTQCPQGRVRQTSYDAGTMFSEVGVVSGSDLTVEAALAKLQFLFTCYNDVSTIKSLIGQDLVGEVTEDRGQGLWAVDSS